VGPKNVLYVVTEHDRVLAFDADSASGNTSKYLWMTSTLSTGETSSDDRGYTAVSPEIGITSTPVVDRTQGAMYVVAYSKDGVGNYYARLHALDLTTGKELFGGPTTVAASYPGTGVSSSNGIVPFIAKHYLERAALLEVNGTIFTTWASHCDVPPKLPRIGISSITTSSSCPWRSTATSTSAHPIASRSSDYYRLVLEARVSPSAATLRSDPICSPLLSIVYFEV
jgi:hypothetical protein